MDRVVESRRSTATATAPQPPDFQTQYDALLDAFFATEAQLEDPSTAESSRRVSRPQRMLELQSQMGHLCAFHGELRRALDHFETIRSLVEAQEIKAASVVQVEDQEAQESTQDEVKAEEKTPEEEPVAEELRVVLTELKINAETNLATIYSRLGDAKTAMGHVLSAKKAMRELQDSPQSTDRATSMKKLEIVLTANYSTLLQTQGAVDDAVAAAETVLDLTGPVPKKKTKAPTNSDPTVDAARLTALGVLTWCARSKGDNLKAHELSLQAAQAVKLGHAGQDALLVARTQNNIGVDCYESRDFNNALAHFLVGYRACVLNQTATDASLQARIVFHVGRCLAELGTSVILERGEDDDSPGQMSATECFTQVQETANTLSVAGSQLKVLAQSCLGEQAFYDGEFVVAESHLSAALATLGEASEAAISKTDRVKIQGYVESYLGTALFAEGKLDAAEEAHQRDLELALDTEDLHAQLRALRNLALLYSSTQRFVEGITLWRETLEIAAVLDSKRDLLIGYAGLGAALKALTVVDFSKNEYQEFLAASENQLRPIFLKQRALAMEQGDLTQQVLAQRLIVGTYEWQPQTDELEQRLEECDALVRFSEQLGDLQYRAAGYRALANAITVQIARLAERGQRFADAIRVLKFKRNVFLQKLRDGTKAPKAAAMPLRCAHARIEVLQSASGTIEGAC